MPTGLNEMLEALDQAINDSPWWLPSAPALQLVGRREVLGQYGTLWHGEPINGADVSPVSHPDTTFSFTRAQCIRMRKVIRKAARHDAKQR